MRTKKGTTLDILDIQARQINFAIKLEKNYILRLITLLMGGYTIATLNFLNSSLYYSIY